MNSASYASLNVDDEWEKYTQTQTFNVHCESSDVILNQRSLNIDKSSIVSNACSVLVDEIEKMNMEKELGEAPKCSELHISTKTKVLYLNCLIDTVKTFWRIPVIDYWRPIEGIIKKQTKITSLSQEELEECQEKLRTCGHHYTEMVIKGANTKMTMANDVNSAQTSTKRLKFKDDRKITIGISKKDIMNCRGKQKKAFMNCFAIIIRFQYKGEFREVHVKVFNTGKLEIPGVPDDNMLRLVREKVI